MKNLAISFYACDLLLERNETYEVQIYEPNYLMIAQDGDLAHLLKQVRKLFTQMIWAL